MTSLLEEYVTTVRSYIASMFADNTDQSIKRPIEPIEINDHRRQVLPKHLTPVGKALDCALEHQCASPKRKEKFYSLACWPKEETLNDSKKTAFAEYEEDTEKYQQMLAHPTERTYINKNLEDLQRFASHLCNLARHRQNYNHFLIGEYGEGKTFLINYILSCMQQIFDDSKVINIKIDLAYKQGTNPNQLDDDLALKTIAIIKDQYFKKNKPLLDTYVEHLTAYNPLETCQKKTIINYVTTDVFTITKKTEAMLIYESFKAFLLLQDYKFVFIVDGFDNYNRDYISEAEFKRRIDNLQKRLDQHQDLNSLYLFVMREESYKYFRKKYDRGNPQIHILKTYRLFNVDSRDIINCKLNMLKTIMGDYEQNIENLFLLDKEVMKKEITRSKEFISLIEKFKDFINGYIVNSFEIERDINRNIYVLNRIFNGNNRSIISAIRAITKDILLKIETHPEVSDWKSAIEQLSKIMDNESQTIEFFKQYRYVSIHALMLNQYKFCIPAFDYHSSSKNNAKETSGADVILDPYKRAEYSEVCLIPNIFTHGDISLSRKDKKSSQDGPIKYQPFLIKLRTLQCFNYYNSINIETTYQSIASTMEKFFNYEKEWVYTECKMLYAEECISRIPEASLSERNFYKMRITDRGRFVLDDLIYRYSYLENALEYAPLPTGLCKSLFNPIKSIVGCQEAMKKDKKTEMFSQAIASKIAQVLSFTTFLKTIEDIEITDFKHKSMHTYFSFDKHSVKDDLSVSIKIAENIVSTITSKILDNDFGKNKITPHLEELLKKKIKELNN